jgi:hypothetical protein
VAARASEWQEALMKTVSISAGVVDVLAEALTIAATQLDEMAKQTKRYRHDDVRAGFYRHLLAELIRALDDKPHYPGCVCLNYEAGQDWHR